MGQDSEISWTNHTFNPWWGCVKVSRGCKNCYAETFARRVGLKVWGQDERRRLFGEKHWAEPLKWNEAARKAGVRARVFCASMADVFEDFAGHPQQAELQAARARLFALIETTPWLAWLLLTKRPENLRRMLPPSWLTSHRANVWLGTTVEDQDACDLRLPHLLATPAICHFVSAEPLVGAIDLRGFRPRWVIVGGESGPKASPMHPAWARRLRDQCEAKGITFHFKQWGEWAPVEAHPRAHFVTMAGLAIPVGAGMGGGKDRAVMARVGKGAAGRILDGRTWDGVP